MPSIKINKLFSFILRISAKEFVWLSHRTTASVIFADERSTPLIAPLIPAHVSYLSVPVRGKTVFLNLRIIRWLLPSPLLMLRGKYSIQGLYLLAIARAVRAKLIVSTIDNNSWGNLYDFTPLRVISIQNGQRNSSDFGPPMSKQDIYVGLPKKKPTTLRTREYFGAGSLFSALAGLEERHNCIADERTVVYVSQFRDEAWNAAINKVELKLARWTYDYARARHLRFYLALDSIRNPHLRDSEITHFQSADIQAEVPDNADRFTNIREAARAALVVGHSSTLLIESLSIGVPALCGIHVDRAATWAVGDSPFDTLDREFLLAEQLSYLDFENHADDVIALAPETLFKKISRVRDQYCEFLGSKRYLQTVSETINRVLNE